MNYIQRKDINGLETVDEFDSYIEAIKMVIEYRISDTSATYYISQRACKNWSK